MVAAKVCPGGGATLSSRTRPVTTGTLCGSRRQSRLAGSMTSGTPRSLCRQGLRCLSVVLVLGCIAVCVGVRIRLFGQGLCLSLRGSGARVYCRARLCADTSMWARIVFVPPWFWCSCSLPCALCTNTAYGQGLRLSLVVLVLVARIGVRIRPMGKDCAFCPWSLCSARVARIGARIRLRGKVCAFFFVVLVLSASCAHWYADTAYGQGLRVFLRSPGAQRQLRVLVCGYGL